MAIANMKHYGFPARTNGQKNEDAHLESFNAASKRLVERLLPLIQDEKAKELENLIEEGETTIYQSDILDRIELLKEGK